MIRLHGKTVCAGICSGTAFVLKRAEQQAGESREVCVPEELIRLTDAVAEVRNELASCATNAENDTAREIFELHCMMLEDEDILSSLNDSVTIDGLTAENAVIKTEQTFTEMLRATGDEYMMVRADDVRDVLGRLKAALSNAEAASAPDEPFILIADELMPGELMRLKNENLSGIILKRGTTYSHVSILIREMGIPAVICAKADEIKNGMSVLLDGSGTVLMDFDEEEKERYIRECSPGTRKGKPKPPCEIYVNLGAAKDADKALFENCDGVGLFRTEFLYMNRNDPPGEEEQFEIYKNLLIAAGEKPVTIRTFDIGSDKQSPAIALSSECNPALGCRGLRVYSLYPQVFETQLRALLRAAVFGNLKIMIPMVNSCNEISSIRKRIDEAADSLSKQGAEYRVPPLGAMIETPAAVMMSGELAACVDFFSVGTNDLTQYTYAVDRQSPSGTENDFTAVVRLVSIAAENAHKAGIKIGICGELASEPELTEEWLKMKIDYLSVAPSLLKNF